MKDLRDLKADLSNDAEGEVALVDIWPDSWVVELLAHQPLHLLTPPPLERSVIYCQTTSVSAAHATHCATYCTSIRPLICAFSGWIRTLPPTPSPLRTRPTHSSHANLRIVGQPERGRAGRRQGEEEESYLDDERLRLKVRVVGRVADELPLFREGHDARRLGHPGIVGNDLSLHHVGALASAGLHRMGSCRKPGARV